MREEKARALKLEEQLKQDREEAEKVALARIRQQVHAEEMAHAARMKAKQSALLEHLGRGKDSLAEFGAIVDAENGQKRQSETPRDGKEEMQGGAPNNFSLLTKPPNPKPEFQSPRIKNQNVGCTNEFVGPGSYGADKKDMSHILK